MVNLRVVKYRGSTHGTNEYPFLIDEDGISVLPVTSLALEHSASSERVSTGIPRLDAMMGGKGYFRGSSVLVSGTAGTGKSSLATHFADAACRRGECVIYFSFEESPSQIMRNMRSIGIDLQQWVKKDLLTIRANRPSIAGLETHLVMKHKLINEFKPQIVILAVNVSKNNLVRLDFADFVLREVVRSGVVANDLVLEVTKSRLMMDVLAPLEILTRLRLKHISLSIDDFGTGHSSLSQLRDIPFDELKIDQSFVHGAGKDKTRHAIFGASLGMARQLGMKTVAEGVADRADWDYVRKQGCDLAQGYFIAKAMPVGELHDWQNDWETRHRELILQ